MTKEALHLQTSIFILIRYPEIQTVARLRVMLMCASVFLTDSITQLNSQTQPALSHDLPLSLRLSGPLVVLSQTEKAAAAESLPLIRTNS